MEETETKTIEQLPEITPAQLEQQLETTIESACQQLSPAVTTALDVLADGASDPEDRMVFRALAKRLPAVMEMVIAPALDHMKENLRGNLSVIVRTPEPPVEVPEVKPPQLTEADPLAIEEREFIAYRDELFAIQNELGRRRSRAENAAQKLAEARAHREAVYAAALRGQQPRKAVAAADDRLWKELCEDAQAADQLREYQSQHSDLAQQFERLNAKGEALAQQQALRAFAEFAKQTYLPALYECRQVELQRQALISAAMQRWPNTQRVQGYHLPVAAGLPFKCGLPDGLFTSSTNNRTILENICKVFGEYDLNLLDPNDPLRDEILRVRKMEADAQRQAHENAGPFSVAEKEDRRRRGL
jgi:hypothetical protein